MATGVRSTLFVLRGNAEVVKKTSNGYELIHVGIVNGHVSSFDSLYLVSTAHVAMTHSSKQQAETCVTVQDLTLLS